MYRIVITAFAAALALASASSFAREVQLNDQERADLRMRAESYEREGRHDRTMEMRHSMDHMAHATSAKMHRMKHKSGAKMHKAKHKVKRKAHRMHQRASNRAT